MTLKKRWLCFLCFVLICSVALTGCKKEKSASEASEESTEVEPYDDDYPVMIGEIEIKTRPLRVASLADSITEKIYDLGLEETLVAVSTYCDFPAAAADLPRAGTSQIPDLNILQETGVTTILTSAPLAPTDAQLLSNRGVQVVVIPQAESLAEIWTTYGDIAMVLGGKDAGAQLAKNRTAAAKAWIENLKTAVAAAKTEEIPTLYLKKLELTVATGDCVENEIMELLGLTNIAREKTEWFYPELEAKEGDGLADFKALTMILMDEQDVTIGMLEKSEFYKRLPAVLGDKYIYIDSIAIERQGFSMLEEIDMIATTLWGDASLPPWTGGDSGSVVDDSMTDDAEENLDPEDPDSEDPGDNDTPDT